GDFEGELEFSRKAWEGLSARFGGRSSNGVFGATAYGWGLVETGAYAEAEALLAPLDGAGESEHWRVGYLVVWGEAARRAGRLDDARERLSRAVALAKKAHVEDTTEGLDARWRFALIDDKSPWPEREKEIRDCIAKLGVNFAP